MLSVLLLINMTFAAKQFADESSNEDEVTFTDGSQGFKVEAYYVILDRLRCLSKGLMHTKRCMIFLVFSSTWTVQKVICA